MDKSNKPAKVNEVLRKFRVHQSAAQTWCFARFLPLFVGSKVSVDDEKWETFLLLRDLLFYACASALGRGHILSMSDIINEFHERYRRCFPDDSLKPKFHYTLHYPFLMCQFGPLLHLQTLRFEAKHNYFKELVFRTKNRTNICKSLAERHQFYQSTFNTGGKFLSSSRVDSTGGTPVPLVMLNNDFQHLLAGIVHGDEVFLCNSVKFLGITYWKDTCVVTGLEGFQYQFCKIVHCAIIQGQAFLLCQRLRTVDFERHFHAFAVEDTDHYEVYKVSDIPETNPLGIYDHPNPLSRFEMERKFLTVKFGSQNKKIAVQEINFSNVVELVKDRFAVKSPDIKYFDEDVGDWVDLEKDSEEYITDLRILKLTVVETDKGAAAEEPAAPNIEPSDLPTLNSPSTSTLSRPSTPSSRASTPTSRPRTPNTNFSESSTSKSQDKSWCRQYKIPKSSMSRTVLMKLDNKEELTAERRNLLDGIYNDVTRFAGGMYPTSEMYEDIVDGLMREYPYLLTYRDLPPASAREFWKDKVIYKFGNARKLLDKNHPDVKSRKKKEKVQTDNERKDLEKTFTWGLAKFLPEQLITEDEVSLELHIKWLQREHKKTDPDFEAVVRKMEITFPHHRELVVRQSISVKELIEKSPWLASRNELLREFERLEPNTPSNDLADLLSVGLTKYRKGIVRLLKSKKKHDLLSQIEETSQHYRTEGQRSYADDCMALAGLPVLFKEKTELLLIKDENAEQPMGIKFKNNIMTMDTESFIVYAEGTEVFKCDSFFEAYTGLLACIYVMNLAYPKGLEKTLLFVQNILIGLKDNAEKNYIDKRIVNVLSLINAELKKQ